jgi:hypothetical protein
MESKRTILTGRPPSASVLVRTLIMSTSQNLIWLSTPTAKYRLFAVSNCTMPAYLVLNPEFQHSSHVLSTVSTHKPQPDDSASTHHQENKCFSHLKYQTNACPFRVNYVNGKANLETLLQNGEKKAPL